MCPYLNELKNNNSTKSTSSTPSTGKAQLATSQPAIATTAQDSNSQAHGIALISHESISSSSSTTGLALRGAHNKTHEVWCFDTCASHHITADFSHLQEPTLAHTEIEVGGGRVLIGTHRGTVMLSVEVAGEVVDLTLSNVVFIPGWGDTGNLISWNVIASLGTCRLVAEDNWFKLFLKKGNKIILEGH